ncbi:MAG: hypothetical protein JNM99_00420 [Verrucomicrobiaceae bacterium]|nr:hypothetical protein [Verrucomicrobiaceae bacterium]
MKLVPPFANPATPSQPVKTIGARCSRLRMMMRWTVALALGLASQSQAQLLSGVTELRFQAATSAATGPRSVTFKNVRARSSTTTLDDYLEIDYKADPATLQLKPAKVTVFKGVGIYNYERGLLLKDVPATFTWKAPTGSSYTSNLSSTVSINSNGSVPIVLNNLTAGSSLTIWFYNPSGAFSFALTNPGEPKPTSFPNAVGAGSGGIFLHKVPILRAGTHSLWVIPSGGASSVSLYLKIGNENVSPTSVLTSGQSFSASFSSDYRTYVKRKIYLKVAQKLTVTFPSANGGPDCRIIGEDGVEVSGFSSVSSGVSISCVAPSTGYYYVVLAQTGSNLSQLQTASATAALTVE